MKTVVLKEPGRLVYTETVPNDHLAPDEALLSVHRVGICGTDYHAYRGQQPFFSCPRILGHELGVEVIDIGPEVHNVRVGDRCAVEPYLSTAPDQATRRGFTNYGEHISVVGVHRDGGLRARIKLPARYLHASATLSYDQLALIEPLGIGCHAVNRARIEAEDLVLVVGAGPIGLATAQSATAAGARTVVMDINPDRLASAESLLNLAGTIIAEQADTQSVLRNHFNGDLPTVVLDATGNRTSMQRTLEYAAPAGRIVFVGLFQGDFSFPDPYFHQKELTLMASRNALPTDFRQIIGMMECGTINAEAWITHRSTLEDMIDQFDDWLRPEAQVIKAMVSVS